ncbi:MAG TPA: lipoyl(octanoyl) transferase LipB [Kaistiaceae bacterium]|nr:lipoyl(octanoyl) transferase LipB [Kaistiaceae bacterium]
MEPLPPLAGTAVEWRVSDAPVGYRQALCAMEARVEAVRAGTAPECVWLLEHPPLYTAGTSADPAELVDADRFPVFEAGRGGRYTYHGPGQRIAYVMLDLRRRGGDVRRFVYTLEEWLIGTLWRFHVRGERRSDRVGVWVRRPDRGATVEDKIAALGIRVRGGVTFHGVSLNVDPDLSHFAGIVPCGISEHGVTSLEDLGHIVSTAEVDGALRAEFERLFGPTLGD